MRFPMLYLFLLLFLSACDFNGQYQPPPEDLDTFPPVKTIDGLDNQEGYHTRQSNTNVERDVPVPIPDSADVNVNTRIDSLPPLED